MSKGFVSVEVVRERRRRARVVDEPSVHVDPLCDGIPRTAVAVASLHRESLGLHYAPRPCTYAHIPFFNT